MCVCVCVLCVWHKAYTRGDVCGQEERSERERARARAREREREREMKRERERKSETEGEREGENGKEVGNTTASKVKHGCFGLKLQ